MTTLCVLQGDPSYPALLTSCLGPEAPAGLELQGSISLLNENKLALFCSQRCPGSVLIQAYDLANALRQNVVAVMGGFHAPVEREWLSILCQSATRIIRCPARELSRRRLTPEDRQLLEQRRLLLLGFGVRQRRTTQETAFYRNVCMAALADKVFIAHAAPGSKTWALCRQALMWGKPVYTFADPQNAGMADLGAQSIRVRDFIPILTN